MATTYPFSKITIVSSDGISTSDGIMIIDANNVLFKEVDGSTKTLLEKMNKIDKELSLQRYVTQAEYIEILKEADENGTLVDGRLQDNITYFIR